MGGRQRLLCFALAFFLVSAWWEPVAAGEPVALAVHQGRCEVVLPTDHGDDQFYLILGALGRNGPYRVEVKTAATIAPLTCDRDQPIRDPEWSIGVKDLADRQARARQGQADHPGYPPLTSPPPQKTFHLFVHNKDYQNPSNYLAVTADLQAIGKHCQVYVDTDHADLAGLRPTIVDAVHTFDEEIFPRSLQMQGRALDVDRDGRFTILFSAWLGKLQSGKVKLSGFVRGSDFYRDLRAPFSNHCDMLYLNTNLKPGGYLRTVLAHEFTHAVLFSEHVFGDYLAGQPRKEEESWLNEGLSHLAEELHGYSWANLDYRISGFLNAPERHALVVPDYYGSGLWRTPGNRGSVFLFLHWCRQHYGPEDFAARLIQSNLQGVANLEAATQRTFAELFRGWTSSLITGAGQLNFHARLGSRLLCGPRLEMVPMAQGEYQVQLTGTAAAYCLLHSPGMAHTRLTVTADSAAELQVTLLRLPRHMPRLKLQCERLAGTSQVRLRLTAQGGPVRLCDAAWERLGPTGEDDTSAQNDRTAAQTIRDWFGDERLTVGAVRRSAPLTLPPGLVEAVVFRVLGRDGSGRVVTAWAVLNSVMP